MAPKAIVCYILTWIILFGITGCLDPITYQDPDLIHWPGLEEPVALQLLNKRVSLSTSADSVQLFLKKQNLSPSQLTPHNTGFFMTASTPIMREKVMTKSKWLLKFYFDKSRRLTKIKVRKSLISF